MQRRSEFLVSAGASAAVAAATQLGEAIAAGGTSVILVHAAWADGTCWSKVIVPLTGRGVNVIAAPIPLTSLDNDVAAVEHIIGRTTGPVMLVSHAYAGAVISSVRDPRVKSLVFINSLLPAEGETVADVFYRKPPHPRAPRMKPDANGLIWMPHWAFASSFAPNATPSEQAVLAAVQRPLSLRCIQKHVGSQGWKSRPSWYLLAEHDDIIDIETQRFMANRVGAKTRSYPVDHTSMVTAPEHVVDLISEVLKSNG